MVVYCLEVRGVKAAVNGRCMKLSEAKSGRSRRRSRKIGWVGDAELVLEHTGARYCEVQLRQSSSALSSRNG